MLAVTMRQSVSEKVSDELVETNSEPCDYLIIEKYKCEDLSQYNGISC